MATYKGEMSASESCPLLKRHHHQREVSSQPTSDTNCPLGRDAPHVPQQGHSLAYPTTIGDLEYKTIDWWSDLIKDSKRRQVLLSGRGLKSRLRIRLDASSGWIIAAFAGVLTAVIAFVVDICEEKVESWKNGYCTGNILSTRRDCCNSRSSPLRRFDHSRSKQPFPIVSEEQQCFNWIPWAMNWWLAFCISGCFSVLYALISAVATATTNLPVGEDKHRNHTQKTSLIKTTKSSKSFSMAAGSGIPELKSVLNGFEIPNLLSVRVLLTKSFGAIFAVASGMCLGKEGPYVHIAACVGHSIASKHPKYRDNGRKLREILAATIASGLCVAFGAPIGGVLFSYEEISTYFPRKTLWRAFVCSMMAAIVLKFLNPRGTDKLALFEIDYSASYSASYYVVFVLLGVTGGIWGATFCRLNFLWSRWFRSIPLIKYHPVLEIFLIISLTTVLQYPNPLTRDSGEQVFRNLLTNCVNKDGTLKSTFVCIQESRDDRQWHYVGLLVLGCLVKLALTTITFGAKVPSGIIIPALDAGALFGRLLGVILTITGIKATLSTPDDSGVPNGLLAMVGAAAFLAGVSRMTISLCVIMFELTGQLDFLLPHMVAIITAKWTADLISEDSIYDVAQSLMAHPFLDYERVLARFQEDQAKDKFNYSGVPIFCGQLKEKIAEIEDMTLRISFEGTICSTTLSSKLDHMKMRDIKVLGFVLIDESKEAIHGFITMNDLASVLDQFAKDTASTCLIRLLNKPWSGKRRAASTETIEICREEGIIEDQTTDLDSLESSKRALDISSLVDVSPLILYETTPAENTIEAFGKLGLRYIILIDEASKRFTGILTKEDIIGI